MGKKVKQAKKPAAKQEAEEVKEEQAVTMEESATVAQKKANDLKIKK